MNARRTQPDDPSSTPDGVALWFKLACHPATVRRALITAVVVGAILIAINQGDAIVHGDSSHVSWLRGLLTAIVPYLVSTASSVSTRKEMLRARRSQTVQAAVRSEAKVLHIALLRAVNVSGHNPVGMADLRQLLTKLGFRDARSLLQSGNLVFASDARSGDRLESQLEAAMKRRLGLETDVFVRSASEWKAVVAGNPFVAEAQRDPGHLLVMPLKDAPDRASVTALQSAISGRELVRVKGRHAYLVYPDGVGRSRLTNAMIERKLGTRGTGRNWNTVLKLAALVKTA